MNVGSSVRFKDNPQQGIGKIVGKNLIFGRYYYEVFFSAIDKVLQLTEQDLEPLLGPAELLAQGVYAPAELFKLKCMAYQLETLLTGARNVSPVNFKIKPLPHQLLAMNFVLNQFKPRCLLADEVGLGKTIEAALIFEELKLRGVGKRILIITPAGLTQQWQEELKLKFSEDFYLLDSEKARALMGLHGQEANVWLEFNQVITSIDFLKPKRLSQDLSETERQRREEHNRRVYQDCIGANWDVVIVDEAHKLTKYESGEETARYKLGAALAETSPIFLLLTATPHNGNPEVFKHLLQLLDPYLFYRNEDLTPENVKTVTVRNKKRAVVDMEGNRIFKNRLTTICEIDRSGSQDDDERLLYEKVVEYVSRYYNLARFERNQTMIFLLMLYQRIVSSSSKAILSSLEKRYAYFQELSEVANRSSHADFEEFVELDGEVQLEMLEGNMVFLKNQQYILEEMKIIAECLDLARRCARNQSDAKLRQLIRIIDEVKQRENKPDVKMIIFTEFIETQNYIADTLTNLGYKTACINGHLSLEEKMEEKNRFKEEAQFLISTDAGGEGINLQFCAYMVNYDLPWNPMKLEQRIGRIDRIGQQEDVKIFNFVLKDTIEEYVRQVLETKLQIIKEQFGEDKLQDILSTLQEEFNFDKLYFDAVVERRRESARLDKIAQEMFDKAQAILEKDEFLIPFKGDGQNISQEEKCFFSKLPERVKEFMTVFLPTQGMELKEYSNQKDVYYFKNLFQPDKFGKHFSRIIFDPGQGLDSEDAQLFSLNHEYVLEAIKVAKDQGTVSIFEIEDERFVGKEGLLSFWLLQIENNHDYKRNYYLPIFIESTQRYNRRISRFFDKIENIAIQNFAGIYNLTQTQDLFGLAEREVQKEGEDIFLEDQVSWQAKVEEKLKKLNVYYSEQERAIKEIKIENIRESKLKMNQKEWFSRERELREQMKLVPKLTCQQLAFIRFR